MIGRNIAHYQILETLGQGGMGFVYKARDTQLDRFVAVKVLTPDKVTNHERKLRFVQEAKAASALSHPNIVTVYNIGHEDGVDYIVMELVAGRTLDHVIPPGGLKTTQLLKYAVQIADALARAHSAGIIHRDLKPGNIMISEEGQAKLLDFGLAKLSDLHDATDAELTRTAAPETEEGRILGTVCYMSPEQAEARKADARSDIFSLGAVLYEMATGTRAFMGRSKISTLAAILQSNPKPAAELHSGMPRDLARIIERCLRKDPASRYQSAADLKISLADLLHETENAPSEAAAGQAALAAPPPRRRAASWIVVLLLGLALGAAIAWQVAHNQAPPLVYGQVKPLTSYSGIESEPALSPDGKQIAFSWDGPNKDNFDIYVHLVESGAALRVTSDPAPDHAPAWSPDGQQLAFLRNDAIYLVPAIGGVERKLATLPKGTQFQNLSAAISLSWSPDNRFLAFNSNEDGAPNIWVVSIDSGEKHTVSKPPKGYYMELSPAFSPDGRKLAYIRARDSYSRTVVMQDLGRDANPLGPEREIIPYDRRIEQLAWQPDGRAVIVSARVMGERTGLFRLTVGGAMQPLGIDSGILLWPTLSRTGNRLAFQKRQLDSNIYRMDGPGPEGGPRPVNELHEAVVIDSTASDREPVLSPDGRRLAFNSDRLGWYEIHVAGTDGTRAVALTSLGPTAVGSPRWSPDSQTIVFDRYANGHSMIYAIGAGGGKPKRITSEEFRDFRPSFSRDSKWIYFSSNRSGRVEIWKVPSTGGDPQQVTKNSGIEPFESPDGKLLYFTNGQGLWAMPVAGGEPKLVLAENLLMLYALAGKSIYYGVRNPPALWVLRTDTGHKFEYVRFPRAGIGLDGGTVFSVSADERTIFFSHTDRQDSDLMLVENFR